MKKCPTCGSENKHTRYVVAPMDCPVDFKGPISKQLTGGGGIYSTVVENGVWYNGPCPDTWHDVEWRSGKDRRIAA